ncbi:MAG: hypothetical protein KC620_21320 [Myxococcales bacterium]|nr:hypothetical protein [Myxococcales bacterium]
MSRWLLVLALWAGLAACGGRDRGALLRDSVRGFNQSLRWGAFDAASRYVEAEKRADWLQARVSGSSNLRMTDVQIVRVDQGALEAKPGEKPTQEARALVSMSWYRLPDMTVHSAVWRQTWHLRHDDWVLVNEEAVQDAPAATAPSWP